MTSASNSSVLRNMMLHPDSSRNYSGLIASLLEVDQEFFNHDLNATLRKLISSKNVSLDDIMKLITDRYKRVDPTCTYCTGGMSHVIATYNNVHGYISLVVCVLGTFANILNIAVLTRKDMATAPINRILKWLAVTDMLVMIEYIPFAVYRYFVLPGNMDFPRPWAMYLLFHAHFSQVLHTSSICLTLSLAVWRYIAIRYPQLNHVLCTERRCSLAVFISFILPLLLCIPNYMLCRIKKEVIEENKVQHDFYRLDADQKSSLWHINFWTHAVVIKLIPCIILTIISIWLINALYSADQRKLALRSYNSCPNFNNSKEKKTKSNKRTDRTTKMLIAVLILFLITELPQGILGLLSGVMGDCFFENCYILFGELMDILALLNGAINFILYCTMSKQFRITFGLLFKPKILARWPTNVSQTEIHSTCV